MFASWQQVVSGYSYSGHRGGYSRHYGGRRREDSDTDCSESEAEAAACFVRPQQYQGNRRCYDESEDEDSETEDESDDDRFVKGNNRYPRSQHRPDCDESDEEEDEEDEEEEDDDDDDDDDEEEEECCSKQRQKCYGCSRKTSARSKYDEEREEAARMFERLALSRYGDQQKKNRSCCDDRKILIVKDMHLHMSHNKIRNFAWNKKEKISKGRR